MGMTLISHQKRMREQNPRALTKQPTNVSPALMTKDLAQQCPICDDQRKYLSSFLKKIRIEFCCDALNMRWDNENKSRSI